MESKQVLITGGTGFIGRYLSEDLIREGHYITIVSRSPARYKDEDAKNQKFISWADVPAVMENMDVVINLAGEYLFGKRWTASVKKKICDSRIESTRKLVDAMRASAHKPELFISVSGADYYKDAGSDVITESAEAGSSFLSKVCIDWEAEADLAASLGIRVVIPRLGIVLEKNGGVVEKMRLPFALFAGGPIGSGSQYLPWIHMDDLCRALIFPMENKSLQGAYNACSPGPVTMDEFSKAMGRVMNRPSFFRVPGFVLKTVLGEAADPVLGSHRMQPMVLLESGFEFEYDDVEIALADIL
jgi:uncharacterized protein (TIGR01777 family)